MVHKKIIIALGLLIALLAACSPGVAPVRGALAPDFELQQISGETVRLSDYRGQPVLVNFWATWCTPCLIEMPAIQERFTRFAPEGFVVLAVDNDEPLDRVQDFVDEVGLTFPVLLDPGAVVQVQYQVRGYPSSYFIDPEGIIRVVHIGILTDDQLDDYLSQIGVE
ncbi:MAG: redoxin domain-containing protein [Anaerolineae bacterium]|nr:redoxin domain-containing protein [Anaerolineae bacterium]